MEKNRYQEMKEKVRQEAIDYAYNWEEITTNGDKSIWEWTAYFRKLGKRYGLIREFEENAIL